MSSVKINGQSIPWWFIQKIRHELGGDWDQTIEAFYIARKSTDIIKYVSKGMVPNEKGICYSKLPSIDREKGMSIEVIKKWWEDNVHKPKPKNNCVSFKDALLSAIKEM